MDRRQALQTAAGLGVAVAPRVSAAPELPERSLLERKPEAYWKRIREEQFLLPAWRSYLNTGSLGVAPKRVVARVQEALEEGASLTRNEYPRWGYETLEAERKELAAFLGCRFDEIAFTHNATEAMSMIAGGLDLRSGDEVLITDQEHPSGRGPWLCKAARTGCTVREVKLPLPPPKPEELVDRVFSAIGPKTRVLSFSSILTTTGLIMPTREICAAARAKGVITVVDGAHHVGQVPLVLGELGCDFFAGSPHKWGFAPPGSGVLYLREEMQDRLWPIVMTGNWDDKSLKSARFQMVGTNNRAIVAGFLEGLRFHAQLGSPAVYARIHELARKVRAEAAKRKQLELLTPDDSRQFGGLVTMSFRGKDPKPFWKACDERRIWVYKGEKLRVATHIHTRPEDIENLFRVIDETVPV